MTDVDAGTELSKVNYQALPALKEALEHGKFLYYQEEERRKSIETKVGILSATTIGLLGFVLLHNWEGFPVTRAALIMFFAGSVILAFNAYVVRGYKVPAPDASTLFALARRPEKEVNDQILVDLHDSIPHNRSLNDGKIRWLRRAMLFHLLGLALLIEYLLRQ